MAVLLAKTELLILAYMPASPSWFAAKRSVTILPQKQNF